MTYKRKNRQERGSTRIVLTRISESEYEEWKRRSELLGITLSEYIRNAVRKGKTEVIIKKQIEIKPLTEIADQYGKIGNNINQIAHYLNGGAEWSESLLQSLTDNLAAMYSETRHLAKVVDEINGYHKTQSNENADYNAAIEYLEYEHNSSGEIVKDAYGLPQLRDNFIIEGINCEPLSFNADCHQTNELYKKNQKRNEVKSHSYIISFDPRDPIDNGLTLQDVQAFGIEFVKQYLPGYQTIVCSHADGTNGSGNMHCHIVINSIRIMDVAREPYMNRTADNIAGYKHRCTPEFERFIKAKVMEMCQERGLYQVNLLDPARERISDREYYLNLRKKNLEGESYQTRKEYIRCAIRDGAAKSNSSEEFKNVLKAEYDIIVHESRGRYSFILPGRERGITERQLGTIYTKPFIEKVIDREEIYYDRNERNAYQSKDYIPPTVRKLVDIATNEKAQSSKGYERAILLSNLKKTAETINVLSERDIKGIDELELSLKRVTGQYTEISKKIKSIERRTADIKIVLQLKETVAQIEPVIKELKMGKHSESFRKEHEGDLIIYKASKEKLKSMSPELKSFSEKKLSEELIYLTERKNNLYEQRGAMRKDMRDLENARHNIKELIGKERTKQKKIEKTELDNSHARS